MRLEVGSTAVDVTPLLRAEDREWTLPDRQATLSRPLGPARRLRASWTGRLRLILDAEPLRRGWRLSVRVEALRPVRVDELGVRVRGARFSRILVDGYHSWDWAGTRDGSVPGQGWWTVIAGDPGHHRRLRLGLAGQPSAGALALRWDSHGLLDATVTGEPLQAPQRTDQPRPLGVQLRPREAFAADRMDLTEADPSAAEVPGLPRVAVPARRRRTGWMSWNCLGPSVNAADILDARDLVPSGGVILIDDGWMDRWGDWRESRRLAASMPALAAELGKTSHDLGLWVAPFLVDPESEVAVEHPEYLLRDRHGYPVIDERPPRPQWILDASQPEVTAYLRTLGVRLAGAGARVVKTDFLYAGALPGERPPGWSGIRALGHGLGALAAGFRAAAGPQAQVWACGAPGPAVAGTVDCCRSGGDAVLNVPPLGVPIPAPPRFVHGAAVLRAQARNLAARAWLWGATLPCDVDAITFGRVGDSPPVDAEVLDAWVRMARRSGGPLLDSDVPSHLGPPRRQRLRDELTVPPGDPERPVDPLELAPAPMTDQDFLSWPPALPEAWEPA